MTADPNGTVADSAPPVKRRRKTRPKPLVPRRPSKASGSVPHPSCAKPIALAEIASGWCEAVRWLMLRVSRGMPISARLMAREVGINRVAAAGVLHHWTWWVERMVERPAIIATGTPRSGVDASDLELSRALAAMTGARQEPPQSRGSTSASPTESSNAR